MISWVFFVKFQLGSFRLLLGCKHLDAGQKNHTANCALIHELEQVKPPILLDHYGIVENNFSTMSKTGQIPVLNNFCVPAGQCPSFSARRKGEASLKVYPAATQNTLSVNFLDDFPPFL